MIRGRVRALLMAAVVMTTAASAQQKLNEYPPAWGKPDNRPVALVGGTLLDGKGGIVRHAVIVMADGKIVRIGGPVPKDAVVYNLKGYTVTPGLIDTHEHVTYHFRDGRFVDNRLVGQDEPPQESVLDAAENGSAILASGFTTIQSPGPGTAWDIVLRDTWARGILPGPRLLTSLKWFRYDLPGQVIPDDDGLRALVREHKAQGADLIKIFASTSSRDGAKPVFTEHQLEVICGEAKAQGLHTLVHAYTVAVKMAVEAGCTTIEHGTGGMTGEVIKMMIARGTYYDPTEGVADESYVANADKFIGIGNYTQKAFLDMQASVAQDNPSPDMMAALKVPGLKIVFGTDAVAGGHGHNIEGLIYRIRRGGQAPMAALESATSLAAQSIGLADHIGTIAPGMDADIVAMRGDFLIRPESARDIGFVMKAGHVIKNQNG
jgi:imidazolonepropionase-like amidohydrolase